MSPFPRRCRRPLSFGFLTLAAGLLAVACGGASAGPPTPFSLGGSSQVQGVTPTPTAQVVPATPEAPNEPPANGGNGAEGVSGGDRGLQVFLSSGCVACHTLQGVPEAIGSVGPELTGIGSRAGTRTDMEADGYIRQSVLEPGAFVTEGFTNAMPPGLVTAGPDLDALVEFLLSQ